MKTLLVLIALLGLPACATAPSTSTSTQISPSAKPFTMADYGKIKTGMTLAQVENATGFKAKESNQMSAEMMGKTIATTTYTISNSDGSSAVFTVQDGKVASKMQMNLN